MGSQLIQQRLVHLLIQGSLVARAEFRSAKPPAITDPSNVDSWDQPRSVWLTRDDPALLTAVTFWDWDRGSFVARDVDPTTVQQMTESIATLRAVQLAIDIADLGDRLAGAVSGERATRIVPEMVNHVCDLSEWDAPSDVLVAAMIHRVASPFLPTSSLPASVLARAANVVQALLRAWGPVLPPDALLVDLGAQGDPHASDIKPRQ
jgi:hypothetical protein